MTKKLRNYLGLSESISVSDRHKCNHRLPQRRPRDGASVEKAKDGNFFRPPQARRKPGFLMLGLIMSMGVVLFSVNTTVGAQPPPPGPPAIQDGREMRPCQMQGPSKEEQAQMLNLLGIDEKTFRDYVQKGKSLAEIAKRQNVEVQRVVDLLEAQLKEHAREQAEQMVNQKPMMPPPPKPER